MLYSLQQLQFNYSVIKNLNEIFLQNDKISFTENKKIIFKYVKSFELKNVNFKYDKEIENSIVSIATVIKINVTTVKYGFFLCK